jgi:hypothetical protein
VIFAWLGVIIWRHRRVLQWSRTRIYVLYFLALLGPFLAITWARPVARDVSIAFQFRYVLVGLGPLVVLALEGLRKSLGPGRQRAYLSLMMLLVVINVLNTLKHGFFVREDMSHATAFVEDLEARGLSRDEIVTETTNALTALQIPSDQERFYFDYNAQKCIAEWKIRSDLSLSLREGGPPYRERALPSADDEAIFTRPKVASSSAVGKSSNLVPKASSSQ